MRNEELESLSFLESFTIRAKNDLEVWGERDSKKEIFKKWDGKRAGGLKGCGEC